MSVTPLHPHASRRTGLRSCAHCDRTATVAITLGNLGQVPDRCTFYCSVHSIADGLDAVLDYLRAGLPDVVGIVRAA